MNCRVCLIELTDKNWYPSNKIRNIKLCIQCSKNIRKKYVEDNRDRIKKNYNDHKEEILKKRRDEYKLKDKKVLAEKAKKYRSEHIEEMRLRDKKRSKKRSEYSRDHMLGIHDENGNYKKIKCNKRLHTLTCEICGRKVEITAYHHWDDNKPECGLWLCSHCHITVERLEKIPNIKEIYLNLKLKVEGEDNERRNKTENN